MDCSRSFCPCTAWGRVTRCRFPLAQCRKGLLGVILLLHSAGKGCSASFCHYTERGRVARHRFIVAQRGERLLGIVLSLHGVGKGCSASFCPCTAWRSVARHRFVVAQRREGLLGIILPLHSVGENCTTIYFCNLVFTDFKNAPHISITLPYNMQTLFCGKTTYISSNQGINLCQP